MTRFSNRWIKSWLKFSKKDRNGILILFILIIIFFLANMIVSYIPEKNNYDYTEFESAIAEWEGSRSGESNQSQFLFLFDPNTISADSLDLLLLPEFVKRNIVSYRSAGGKINSVSDFRKIYGMNDSIFKAIKDYIVIAVNDKELESEYEKSYPEDEIKATNKTENVLQSSVKPIIEMNAADSAELTKLYGIGPVFASRIVKYRNLLGGFNKKEQLLEVYNFPEETYQSILDDISVDASKIKKIRLNFAEYSELLRHPYLTNNQVQSIVNYRTNSGAFKTVEDLKYLNHIDSATFSRISPYVSCR